MNFRRTFTVLMFLLCLMLMMAVQISAQETPEHPEKVAAQDFTIDLGDFETPTQLTYPADASSDEPFPTVILFHGAGPADMDFTYRDQWQNGAFVSAIFRDIAHFLPTQGFAVLRYNKHYVRSATRFDIQKFYTEADPNLFRADAEIVLDAALENPLIDAERIYLYGWSEGSLIATDLAIDRADDVAGLILQGPVGFSTRDVLEAQTRTVGVDYLRSLAPDGQITPEILEKAAADTEVGLVAKNTLLFVMDFSYFQTGKAKVSATTDTNKDGIIDLDTELIPAIEGIYDAGFMPDGMFSTYRPDHAPVNILEQTDALLKSNISVLILQGENDANTAPENGQAIFDALDSGGGDVTLKLYPGLGHSLGKADSPAQDIFAPIDAQPLADLAAWLTAH